MAILQKPAFQAGILNGEITEPYQSIYEDSTTQNWMLGTKLEFPTQGRVFRYAKAGGSPLVQARMNQSGVTATTYYTAIVQDGYPRTVGDKDITVLVTTGAIAGTATGYAENAFSGGWLNCNKVSPAVLGDIYYILASKMVDETHIDLKLATPWRNTMLATGEVTLTCSKFYGSLVFAAYDATAPANGVALCPVAANEFYWSQTKGPAPLLVDGSETYDIGCMISCPVTLGTAGDAGHHELTTAEVLRQPWGVCMEIATDGEPGLVDLILE
ncbi:MAG TPA: hypothetical protein VMY37_37940 [Thermoguttaceae bacterium]|nr:hypothetical protein [Thermoguttaceae bacterium]